MCRAAVPPRAAGRYPLAGTPHRVLKNFPSEDELRSMIDGIGTATQYWRGAHFRVLRYAAAA